jgi:hypothetical protein
MNISFKNVKTGEVRQVKVGFSWVLFLFAGILGIPLFIRKLNMWGSVFLAVWVVNLLVSSLPSSEDVDSSVAVLFIVAVGLQIYMGIKGNELTAKNYLETGWELTEPDAPLTQYAKKQWGLA